MTFVSRFTSLKNWFQYRGFYLAQMFVSVGEQPYQPRMYMYILELRAQELNSDFNSLLSHPLLVTKPTNVNHNLRERNMESRAILPSAGLSLFSSHIVIKVHSATPQERKGQGSRGKGLHRYSPYHWKGTNPHTNKYNNNDWSSVRQTLPSPLIFIDSPSSGSDDKTSQSPSPWDDPSAPHQALDTEDSHRLRNPSGYRRQSQVTKSNWCPNHLCRSGHPRTGYRY